MIDIVTLEEGEEEEGGRLARAIGSEFGIKCRVTSDRKAAGGKPRIVTDGELHKDMRGGLSKFTRGWLMRHRDKR